MGVTTSATLRSTPATTDAPLAALPSTYGHLSSFPVLAKKARGDITWRPPNEKVYRFLRERSGLAARIADFLTTPDRMNFLHTHKIAVAPWLLRDIFFGGPSREVDHLHCACESTHDSTFGAVLLKTYMCVDHVRYRGSLLCRRVPVRVVARALHRVLRAWMTNRLQKRRFKHIVQTMNRLLAVFRPIPEVVYAVMNVPAEDGTTLLTFAVRSGVPLGVMQKLLMLPCLDVTTRDSWGHTPIELARQLQQHGVVQCLMGMVAC